MLDERLITDREVSKLTGIPRKTLQALRLRGGGPDFIKIRSSCRYRPSEIENWLKANTRKTTSEGGNSIA